MFCTDASLTAPVAKWLHKDTEHHSKEIIMKKTLLPLVAAAALILPSAALAANGGFQGGSQPMGGFQGPVGGSQAETVAAAKKCWDDAPVVLTGTIVERLAGSDDKYTFADSTGRIVVEIDYEVFAGRTVTPQTKVRLFGKVDKEMMEPTKVDVKYLEIVK